MLDDPVVTELALLLRAARDRNEDFAGAWATALPAALQRARSGLARRQWEQTLSDTVETWRDAYDRAPPTRAAIAARAILRHHELMGGGHVEMPSRRARYIA